MWSCIEGVLGVIVYRKHIGCNRVYVYVCEQVV